MRSWVGALGGLIAGAGLGYIYSVTSVEKKVRAEYAESARMRQRAYEMAQDLAEEAPAATEEEVKVITKMDIVSMSVDSEPNAFGGTLDFKPAEKNPYHTPPQILDEAGLEVEMQLISYIDAEEYHEGDGRAKETLTFIGDGIEVHFFEDGVETDDWRDYVGESFLVDFQRLVPYGGEPVLYVRNHGLDVDFQVIREQP
jgi:hypothetical protein